MSKKRRKRPSPQNAKPKGSAAADRNQRSATPQTSNTSTTSSRDATSRLRFHLLLLGLFLTIGAAALVWVWQNSPKVPNRTASRASAIPLQQGDAQEEQTAAPESSLLERETRFHQQGNLTLLWDSMKPEIRERVTPVSTASNIRPDEYAGPERCEDCHRENHAAWSQSSHRWMNALANEETVKGDFSGSAQFHYRGGEGQFFIQDGKYMMRYERSDLTRQWEIHQTIGSRFYQYYVGVGLEGPEPEGHDYYEVDHVLPFGYWIERKAWVPVVHVSAELPDGQRWEPVESLKPEQSIASGIEQVGVARGVVDHDAQIAMTYSTSCNYCHTTFPLGDLFVRTPSLIGPTLTERSIFELSRYVAQEHPEQWDGSQPPQLFSNESLADMTEQFVAFDARDKAATLGISCEACHLGCEAHANNEKQLPSMAPKDPHLLVFKDSDRKSDAINAANVNAACARCHSGDRPRYASGIATWNSTEHSDAMRGSCYSEMSCVHCHNPHQAIGPQWTKTPDQDDQSCLACHEQYTDPAIRQTHTRHVAGSTGDRCMNCHMPHINEGMQDVVRTHTIFSPTQKEMIEQNQPNACNLCHLDRSIDWTLEKLKHWYGKTFDEATLDAHYADRSEPTGLGWLKQEHEATRLVTFAAFARQNAKWGIPYLVDMLDDDYLLNRQFAQTSLERLTGADLNEKYGYWYYMTREERLPVIESIQSDFPFPAE